MKSYKYEVLKWDKAVNQDIILRYLLNYRCKKCYSMVLPRDFISSQLIKKCGQFDFLGNIPVGWRDADDDCWEVLEIY